MHSLDRRGPQEQITTSCPGACRTEVVSHIANRLVRSRYSPLQRIRYEFRRRGAPTGPDPLSLPRQVALAVDAQAEGVQEIINAIEVVGPLAEDPGADRLIWAESGRVGHLSR